VKFVAGSAGSLLNQINLWHTFIQNYHKIKCIFDVLDPQSKINNLKSKIEK